MNLKLEIHFHQQNEVSVILGSDSFGDEEKFGEILLFCLYAMRQMVNLGQQGRSLGEMLAAATSVTISELGSVDEVGGVRLVSYQGIPGRKRFKAQISYSYNNLSF